MKAKFILSTVLVLLFFGAMQAQVVPTPDHVVVVILENHGYSQIIGSGTGAPYINSLAVDSYAALFTNSLAITHPSQPNYLYLFSGSSQGVFLDFTSLLVPFTTANLGAELLQNNRTFIGYSEDMPSVGYTSDTYNNYARKHNPWVNWQGTGIFGIPAASNQPYTSFPTNYASLPTLSFVIPNLQDDMHDGTITQGDTWLQNNLNGYIQWAKTHNSLLILTTDEDENSIGNSTPITTIFIGQMVKAGQYGETIDHNRVLHTMEDMYSLPHAGASVGDTSIVDCWVYRPVSALSGTPTTMCPGQTVTLTDHSTNSPTQWYWSFPGGTPPTSNAQNPTVRYDTAGIHDVTLVTWNHMGYDTLTRHTYITVNPNPSLSFTNSSPAICRGDTVTLTATGAATYTWFPGTNIISTLGNTLAANPAANSVYKVTGSANGCHGDTVTVSVSVNTFVTPAVNISTNSPTTVCSGSALTLTASPVNGGTTPGYQWQINGSNAGTSTAVFNTNAPANNFTVSCVMTSSALCLNQPTAASNVLNLNVIPSAATTVNSAICNGDSYSFKGQSLTAAGTYIDTLTAHNGCDSLVTLNLTVNSLPAVSWSGAPDTVFTTSAAFPLTGASPAGGTYSGPGVTAGNFDPATAGLGTHTITYHYTDNNGCSGSATKTFTVYNVTGFSACSIESEIIIHPNPVNDFLMASSNLLQDGNITPVIYDVAGRRLNVPFDREQTRLTFNTAALPAGVYCIKFNINGQLVLKRFVKSGL